MKDQVPSSNYMWVHATIQDKDSGRRFTGRLKWYYGKFINHNGKDLRGRWQVIAWKAETLPIPYQGEI